MPQFAGTVRWFNNAKGYGFLGRNDGGPDVFAHFSSIQKSGYKTLKEGEAITFDVVRGEKGLQADNVIPISEAADVAHPPQSIPASPASAQQPHHA
ncbi:MAG TPA: cold shock domain-containing protein [Acidobacteriaceae bacterium]|jgi:CspA family cold shock protein